MERKKRLTAARRVGRRIGSGRVAEVYESGPGAVVKLFSSTAMKRSVFREAASQTLAESFGLPVPAVHEVGQFNARWGIAMSRIGGPSFADAVSADPRLLPEYLRAMAELHVGIHTHPGSQLAGAKARLAADIRAVAVLDEALRSELLNSLAALPDDERLCHGDFHPFNILGPPTGAHTIDWQNASCGAPAADVCRSYVLMLSRMPETATQYVDIYAQISGENRAQIFAWLPCIAAARLAEEVPGEVDALMALAAGGGR